MDEIRSSTRSGRSLLKFCREELMEAGMLEKIFSTFPSSCLVLQQQCTREDFPILLLKDQTEGRYIKSSLVGQLP